MSDLFHIVEFYERGVLDQHVTAPAEGLENVSIHPIWAQSNWLGRRADWPDVNDPSWRADLANRKLRDGVVSDRTYEKLKPALRLATLFLSASTEFAVDIAFGDVSQTDQDGRRILRPHGRYGPAERTRLDTEILIPLSQSISFQFGDTVSTSGAWAITHATQTAPVITLTGFDESFLAWICSDDFGQKNLQEKQINWWVFAIAAVHEVMHGIFKRSVAHNSDTDEPWTVLDTLTRKLKNSGPEIGDAWEKWFFGARTEVGDEPVRHYLMNPYPGGLGLAFEGFFSTYWCTIPITMKSVSQFFDGANWRQHLNRNANSEASCFSIELVSLSNSTYGIVGLPCGCAEQVVDLTYEAVTTHRDWTEAQRTQHSIGLVKSVALQAHSSQFPVLPDQI